MLLKFFEKILYGLGFGLGMGTSLQIIKNKPIYRSPSLTATVTPYQKPCKMYLSDSINDSHQSP